MRTRLPLSEFPAAAAFLREYADPEQWDRLPLTQWFHYNPHDPRCFALRLGELDAVPDRIDRAALAEHLAQRQRDWGGDELAVSRAAALAERRTYTVVTGQQCGLFGGPLYTQLKALAAVKLARRLQSDFPAYNFVPVFWIASADSDFDEVRRTYILSRANEVAELALPPGTEDGLMVAWRDVSAPLADVRAQLEEALPGGMYRDEVVAAIRNDYAQPTLNESFARWMSRLFTGTGLVLVEPDDAVRNVGPAYLLSDELREPERFADGLALRNAELEKAGFTPQVQTLPADTNVFALNEGRRHKIARDAQGLFVRQTGERLDDVGAKLEADPTRFFHSALLNPLYQDELLRPVAFLGGAAELAYRAQSGVLADAHRLRLAPAFLRATATLLPEKSVETLGELGWDLPDVYRPLDEALKAALALDRPEELGSALERYFTTVQGADAQLRAAAVALDPALDETFETLRGNLIRHLEKLDKKITASLKQRSEARVRRVTALHNYAYPRQQVQERELNLLTFLPRYGFGMLAEMLDRIEFPSWEHQVLVLSDS